MSKEEERTESRRFGDGGRIREGGVLYVALVKEEEMRERCAFRYAEEEMMECRGTGEEGRLGEGARTTEALVKEEESGRTECCGMGEEGKIQARVLCLW